MLWRIIGGVVELYNEEDRKHKLDYEAKQMMEYNGKNMENVHIHVHAYSALTDIADDHQHVLMGVSGPAEIVGRSHVHPIRIRTSFVEGHWHWVDIMTDIAIAMPDETHCHYFAGRTSRDDGHCHNFSDVTNVSADKCLEEEEEEEIKPCKYKYKRPEDEEYN